MNAVTITIPENLFPQVAAVAIERGLSIEQLISGDAVRALLSEQAGWNALVDSMPAAEVCRCCENDYAMPGGQVCFSCSDYVLKQEVCAA